MKGAMRGLSPRVRGSQEQHGQARPSPGSIPACAGEPGRDWSCNRDRTVYPRVCGGAELMHLKREDDGGLSPRVRGSLLWCYG